MPPVVEHASTTLPRFAVSFSSTVQLADYKIESRFYLTPCAVRLAIVSPFIAQTREFQRPRQQDNRLPHTSRQGE